MSFQRACRYMIALIHSLLEDRRNVIRPIALEVKAKEFWFPAWFLFCHCGSSSLHWNWSILFAQDQRELPLIFYASISHLFPLWEGQRPNSSWRGFIMRRALNKLSRFRLKKIASLWESGRMEEGWSHSSGVRTVLSPSLVSGTY